MKKLIQSLSNGDLNIEEVPLPNIASNEILISSSISLISSGTERKLYDFGKSSLLNKALNQPDKVKEAINKVKSDGFFETYDAIQNKMNDPIPMGYSNVGTVIDVGSKVKDFSVGDRVVSNGSHSEINAVSSNLCAKIPNNVSDEDAVFTVLGSIALQGIRLANPDIGESFLVIGLGIIGLLTGQILKANGCRVFGIDPDNSKCKIAESFGIISKPDIDDIKSFCNKYNNGELFDGVLITASTQSNEPLEIASKITRQRGRIILIGDVGLNINRDLFYKKELKFQVSCSYGLGRYNYEYEKLSLNYPIGFIRWTVKRNFQTILALLEKNQLNVKSLISKTFDFRNSQEAYDFLLMKKSSLGILLKYEKKINNNFDGEKDIFIAKDSFNQSDIKCINKKPIINLIGAGNYAGRTLLPNLKKCDVELGQIISNNGLSSKLLGKRFNFKVATTDFETSFKNSNFDALFITTRHDTHASLTLKCIENKKHVFVEKPLCLTLKDLNLIKEKKLDNQIIMVGFNRRFSKLIETLYKELEKISDNKIFIYTINAGLLPDDHWLHDPVQGGGRIIGEACHFVDLLRFLSNGKISNMRIVELEKQPLKVNNFSILIEFDNNCSGIIHYLSKGNKSFPKENLQVFTSNKVFSLENFICLKAWGVSNFKNQRLLRQDKGHKKCLRLFTESIKNKSNSPIPFDQIYEVHYWLLKLLGK